MLGIMLGSRDKMNKIYSAYLHGAYNITEKTSSTNKCTNNYLIWLFYMLVSKSTEGYESS